MNKNLQWKVILILAVVALSVWAFYPPDRKINLGLDLKGGVHLVLKVRADDGLKLETDTTVERLRDAMTRGGLQVSKIETTSPTTFVVEGVTNDQGFRAAAVDADTVFQRSSGVGSYTYTMRPNIATQLRDETVTQALQ